MVLPVVVHADAGRFGPVLRDVRHLLLLGQHLNLRLLLLRKRHKIVQYISLGGVLICIGP